MVEKPPCKFKWLLYLWQCAIYIPVEGVQTEHHCRVLHTLCAKLDHVCSILIGVQNDAHVSGTATS